MRSSPGGIKINDAQCFICDNILPSLSMTRANDRSQEKESHWLRLIGLKDHRKFTPQDHSAVKGQYPWLSL